MRDPMRTMVDRDTTACICMCRCVSTTRDAEMGSCMAAATRGPKASLAVEGKARNCISKEAMTILVAVGGVSKGSLLKAEVAGQNECGLGGSLSPSLAVLYAAIQLSPSCAARGFTLLG